MVTRRDYNEEAVDAAFSVLLEVTHVLAEYRESIVLIGGWVPYLLFRERGESHVGSMDIDLAIDHRTVSDDNYQTIERLLLERGYERGDAPFQFKRLLGVGDRRITVKVDLLGREYGGRGRGHQHQKIHDVFIRKARGADLVFDAPIEITTDGELPGGIPDKVTLRIASLVPFIIMKSMALDSRLKEKDAYDIYYVISSYPGGVDAVAEEIRPLRNNGLVKEGLGKLAKHFRSVDDLGPSYVTAFLEIEDAEERDITRRRAYELVRRILDLVEIQ
jgi:hypothetical protein